MMELFILFAIIIIYIIIQRYPIYDKMPLNTYKRNYVEMTKMNRDNINIDVKKETNNEIDNDIEMNYDEWTPLSLR